MHYTKIKVMEKVMHYTFSELAIAFKWQFSGVFEVNKDILCIILLEIILGFFDLSKTLAES